MSNPVISIIIINFNTSSITLDCLKSIYQDKGLTNVPFEIIIIDNHSTDNSAQTIKIYIRQHHLKNLKLVINHSNIGYGRANNQAAAIARGNYLLLLNSDTIILHSAISQALDWLSSHPESYACTAQLLNSDRSIQASGGFFPKLFNTIAWCLCLDDLPFFNLIVKPIHPHTPDFYTRDSFYLSDHPQDWITGAFLLIRKSVFDHVGGFDPDFFMYSEELELCYRIHQSYPHLQAWYLIGPQIIHLGGASTKNKQTIFDREYQGILMFFRKHHSPLVQNLIYPFIGLNRLIRTSLLNRLVHV